MERLGRRLLMAALFAGSFALAWWWSSASMLLDIDWDNAAHLYAITEQGAAGVGGYGYTAHMALVPLYALGVQLVRPFGGDPLDGLRLVNALAVAVAAAFLFATLLRLGAGLLVSGLVCAAWMTAVDTTFLLRTVEDDCITLAVGACLFWMLVAAEARPRRGLLVGLTLGAGCLINYAAIVWLPTALLWAAALQRGSLRERVARGLATLGGMALALAVFGVWLGLEGWSTSRYLATVASPPNIQLADAPNCWALLDYFARYLPPLLLPAEWARTSAAHPTAVRGVLWLLGAGLIAGVILPWRRGPGCATWRGRAACLICFALATCSLPAALKNDWAVFERHCHAPLELALLAGLAAAAMRRRRAAALALPLAAIVAGQALAVVAAPRYQSWFGRLELLRRSFPAVVLAESDLVEWDYGRTMAGNLAGVRILSLHGRSEHWTVPPERVILVDDWRRAPIAGAYLSAQARLLASVRASNESDVDGVSASQP